MFILLLCLSILIKSSDANLEFDSEYYPYEPHYKLVDGTIEKGAEIKFETIKGKRIDTADVFNHITLRNTPYHQITFIKMNSEDKRIVSQNNLAKFTAIDSTSDHRHSLILKELTSFGCSLMECIVGFVFYSSEAFGKAIIDNKIIIFKGVLYHKFISKDGFISFGDIFVYDNHFPLVLCPYSSWINTRTLSEFKPKEATGIVLDKFYKRHILQPLYQRNPYATRFICGEIYYSSDRSSVNIGYRMKFLLNTDHAVLQDIKINVLKENLVCHSGQQENDYYHFVYGAYNGKETQMKFINTESFNGVNIYNGTKIYLYNKYNQEIKELNNNGVKIQGNFTSIKPTCVLTVKPLPASLKLYTKDGKEVAFSSGGKNNAKKVLYVDEETKNNLKDYRCRLVVDNAHKEYFKNFYANIFDAQLISLQSNGDEKFIKNLTFNENLKGFGKYSCKLIQKDGAKDRKGVENIEGLTFEILPSGNLTTLKEEVWNSTIDAMIHCDMFANKDSKLSDMSVFLSNTSNYTNSIQADKKMFVEETTYTRFKIIDYINENKTFEKIIYNCIYRTVEENVYSVQKKAIISNPGFLGNDLYDSDSKGKIILIILGIILIILFVASVIASIIILKRLRKNRDIRKKFALGRSSSSSSSCSSSSSSYSKSKGPPSGMSSSVSGSVSGRSKHTSSKATSKNSMKRPATVSKVHKMKFVTR